jgi:hypothetical protein
LKKEPCSIAKFDLLRKTELKIEKIVLKNANLNEIAAHVAEILDLNRSEVLVVDYLNEVMALDILNTLVNAYLQFRACESPEKL